MILGAARPAAAVLRPASELGVGWGGLGGTGWGSSNPASPPFTVPPPRRFRDPPGLPARGRAPRPHPAQTRRQHRRRLEHRPAIMQRGGLLLPPLPPRGPPTRGQGAPPALSAAVMGVGGFGGWVGHAAWDPPSCGAGLGGDGDQGPACPTSPPPPSFLPSPVPVWGGEAWGGCPLPSSLPIMVPVGGHSRVPTFPFPLSWAGPGGRGRILIKEK